MGRITIDPGQRGGVPCIRGLRIPVATVVGMIAAGMTPDEVIDELPALELADVRAALLREAGHDVVHTLDIGMATASDAEVLELADREQRVVVTGDTDFGALLALTRRRSPSVILFRSRETPRAVDQARVILDHLDDVASDLPEGAVVVVTDDRRRVRRLPLVHDD